MMIPAVVGIRFDDVGFRDIKIPSGVVDSVLRGKMNNRAIYAHKTFYESLHRILALMFIERCTDFCSELKGRRPFWLLNPPG